MKNTGWNLLMVPVMASALLLSVGCASENKGASPASATTSNGCVGECSSPVNPGAVGTGTDPSTTGYSSGSTVTLNVTNLGALQRTFSNDRPANPQNLRVNIDANRGGDAIIISYVENGRLVEMGLGTTHPYTPGLQDRSLNKWYTQNGQSVWKGFFQNSYRTVVLVLDRALGQGDGQAPSIIGGSIWFQNFNMAPYGSIYGDPQQGSQKMCWQITRGNHDCRTFLVGGVINMTSSLYPSGYGPDMPWGYEKLGDIDGLSRASAGL